MKVWAKKGTHVLLAVPVGAALVAASWMILLRGQRVGVATSSGKNSHLTVRERVLARACPDSRWDVVSPNAKRYACALGHWSRLGWEKVVVDGVEGKVFSSVEGFSFGPGGKRWAYQGKRNGRYLFVIDGSETGEYRSAYGFSWSPDGRRVAFIVESDSSRYSFVVADGKTIGQYQSVSSPLQFSPDGRHLAYIARRWLSADSVSALTLILDGSEGPAIQETSQPRVVFSPDGQRIAYVGGSGGFMHQGSVFVKPIDEIRGAKTDDTPMVQVPGGLTNAVYDDIESVVFGPDSKHLAYIAGNRRPSRNWVAVVDGVERRAYDSISVYGNSLGLIGWGLVFAPDSSRVVYGATRGGKSFVVLGGTELPAYDSVQVGGFFSPDGKRSAYAALAGGRWFAVVDGVQGKAYEDIRGAPVFSPDSRRVAYLARRQGKWVAVVEGLESRQYDDFPGGGKLVFDGPNLLHTVAMRDGTVFCAELSVN